MDSKNLGRRDFLKCFAAGAAGAGMLGWPNRSSMRFDELWQMMIEYNAVRNTAKTSKGSEAFYALQDQIKRWKNIRSFGEEYFPESHLDGIKQEDYAFQADFFKDNGKVYIKMPSAHKPDVASITLGTMYNPAQLKELIGTDGKESFEWKGKKADYNVIAFEQDAQSLDDILGGDDSKGNDDSIGSGSYYECFTDDNKTAYINITVFKKTSRDIYQISEFITNMSDDGNLDPQLKMTKEVYDKIKEDIEKQPGYSLLSEQGRYRAFEERFLKVMARSWVNHEKMHNFTKNEAQAWLYQASQDPRYNAMPFIVAGDKYQSLNNALSNAGITMDDIANMSSEERAQRMGEILNNIDK